MHFSLVIRLTSDVTDGTGTAVVANNPASWRILNRLSAKTLKGFERSLPMPATKIDEGYGRWRWREEKRKNCSKLAWWTKNHYGWHQSCRWPLTMALHLSKYAGVNVYHVTRFEEEETDPRECMRQIGGQCVHIYTILFVILPSETIRPNSSPFQRIVWKVWYYVHPQINLSLFSCIFKKD